MPRFRLITALALSLSFLLLSGCDSTSSAERKAERARQEAEQARMRAAFLGRVHDAESSVWQILHPLIEKAANYRSEETHGYIGAAFVTEAFYSEALIEEARAEGFGPWVTVLTVFPDSPAESAGLRAGDRLLSLNGDKVPQGARSAIFAARQVKRRLEPGGPNQLEVQRGDEVIQLEVTPVEGAYYGVIVVASNAVDLEVDGDVIWIGLSLVEGIKRDEDLAYLCAYALAKNVMRHSKQKGKNAMLGQLLDVAAAASGVNTGGIFGGMGGNAYSHAFEVEADLIALYLLASADYEIQGYPEFWDKVLRSRSRKGELTAKEFERVETAGKVIAAIEAKREAGEAIYPEAYLQGDVSEIE
ncbi:M48 family metallopeptidase [Pelagicoccus sp. SDUM812002]|uniref:M48 family metallopeptidase n=1 Tax=Pelagicoccus sp. SDUM812002 TaxID=3041266 RepID=UPI00280D196A|nr:M48 family metallopeptidase [Pelagicoccus sp. SDUM812002]MDQ8187960.1 M48 family metallopeptidase [Pelagicoccus sp. SDUM812002]